jgi:hypothetical protein
MEHKKLGEKMRALDTSVKMLMEKLDGIGATEELH